MNKDFLVAVAKRFAKAFLAGGLAQVALVLTTQPLTPTTWMDLQRWLIVLTVAFVTGGLLALDKFIRFDKEKQ